MLPISKLSASLVMFSYSTDPAIITAGDEVDLIVSFRDEPLSKIDFNSNIESYEFELRPKDDLTKKYITIIDSKGDDLAFLDAGKVWNVKFKIKVNSNAIPATYTLELVIKRVDKKGNVLYEYRKDVSIEVKKIGANVVIGNVITDPAKVRVGDDNVLLNIEVANMGRKTAKQIKLLINGIPGIIENKYSTDNYKFLATLNPYKSKTAQFFFEVSENASAGVYNMPYTLTYLDEDDRVYQKKGYITLTIHHKPILIISKSKGSAKAGGKGKLYVYVKNVGEEKAENVVARLVLDASLPFKIEDRSFYLGDLKPGEERLAVFDIKVNKNANIANYDLKVFLRAKGDSDENDDNIYTFARDAQFIVNGKEANKLFYLVYAVLGILILYIIYLITSKFTRKKATKQK
jgi:hypothetical protein